MSFYRTLLAAVAAVAIATPAFAADDASATTTTTQTSTEAAPIAGDNSAQATTTTTTTEQTSKINVNSATAKELMKVKGINAAKARAIVAYRKKNGNFQSTDDLSKVKGFKKMTPETMKEIQDQLSAQ